MMYSRARYVLLTKAGARDRAGLNLTDLFH